MNRRSLIKRGCAVVGIGGLSGCSSPDSGTNSDREPEMESSAYPNATHSHEPEADFIEFVDFNLEQREGYDIYATGTIENLTGRPIGLATVDFSIYDEIGDVIETIHIRGRGILHGDLWQFEQEWIATTNEKKAAASYDAVAEVPSYSEPRDVESDFCAETEGYTCVGDVRIVSSGERFVTIEEGGQRWTVYGEVKKNPESDVSSGAIIAQYIESGTIVNFHYDGVSFYDGDEVSRFRIEFDRERPPGDLRLIVQA